MPENQKPLTVDEFFEIKHQIDDEVARIGWSVDKCKRYIVYHYGCRSRRTMTDNQLLHFLAFLQSVKSKPVTQKLLTRKKRRR